MIPNIDKEDKKIINSENINNFERINNINLPLTYKEFILENGVGFLVPNIYYSTPDLSEEYSFGVNGLFSLEEIIEKVEFCSYNDNDNFDFKSIINFSNVIPIAQSDNGLICMCILGNDYDKIYFWQESYDRYFDDKEFNYKELKEIANSFEYFINNFGDIKEEWLE